MHHIADMDTEKISLIDTHCHLDMDSYQEDLDLVLERAARAGISSIITIGIDLESSRQAIDIATQHKSVYATIGIHPHDAKQASEDDLTRLAEMAGHEKVVGYGEIGLDYAKLYSPKKRQKEIFHQQLSLAKRLELPVIIHDRDAHEDTLNILQEHAPFPRGGILHCFSGDLDFAKKILDLNFYISIPGIVTFKNAKALQEVAKKIPLESMLLETDGPFLAPVPFRGKRNEPAYLRHTAERISELRLMAIEELAMVTSTNACNIFALPEGSV
jgi:TatD DNase family protein